MKARWSVWFTLCAAASAQDFKTCYQHAESLRLGAKVAPAIVRQAYLEALAAFARLPDGSAARGEALPAAAFSAEQADQPARAAELASESMALGHVDAFHVELLLRALARAGQAPAVVAAVDAHSREQFEAVTRALASVYRDSAGALCEAAEVCLREGRVDRGLRTFAALAAAVSRHPTALANWALALHHVGRDDEAEARYREALAAAPQDAEIWNDLGLLLKGMRRDAEAMAAFRRSHELDPTPTKSGAASTNLVVMQRTGRAPDAKVDVTETLRGVLTGLPTAAMARRLLLDELRERRPFPTGRPDSGGPAR